MQPLPLSSPPFSNSQTANSVTGPSISEFRSLPLNSTSNRTGSRIRGRIVRIHRHVITYHADAYLYKEVLHGVLYPEVHSHHGNGFEKKKKNWKPGKQ